MNCGLCYAYLRRKKNNCRGCRLFEGDKPVSIARCKIRNCPKIKNKEIDFCFKCSDFPCGQLKNLDKRYRDKYNMSEIGNLNNIKNFGIEKFLEDQKKRWMCEKCGGVICVHKKECLNCK